MCSVNEPREGVPIYPYPFMGPEVTLPPPPLLQIIYFPLKRNISANSFIFAQTFF
jgi:hypothetical protein